MEGLSTNWECEQMHSQRKKEDKQKQYVTGDQGCKRGRDCLLEQAWVL